MLGGDAVKSQIRRAVSAEGAPHERLMFACPGCAEMQGGDGVHMLPVNTDDVSPSWTFDGDLEAPTLGPSILSQSIGTCHSFLRNGIFEFLPDSTHSLAGTSVAMPDLPEWVEQLK